MKMSRVAVVSAMCAGVIVVGAPAQGATIEVEYLQVGGFYGPPDEPGISPAAPDNDPVFQNYFVGRSTIGGVTLPERRAFFGFDLSTVTLPAGETISSVTMKVESLFGGTLANFSGGSEFVSFTSTAAPFGAILDPGSAGVSPEAVFVTFGTGTEYGGVDFTMSGPAPGVLDIPFSPDGVMDVEASIGAPTPFVVSSRLVTFDPAPAAEFEFAFGLTDLVDGGFETPLFAPTLVIETIPAPGTIAVFGMVGVAGIRKRR